MSALCKDGGGAVKEKKKSCHSLFWQRNRGLCVTPSLSGFHKITCLFFLAYVQQNFNFEECIWFDLKEMFQILKQSELSFNTSNDCHGPQSRDDSKCLWKNMILKYIKETVEWMLNFLQWKLVSVCAAKIPIKRSNGRKQVCLWGGLFRRYRVHPYKMILFKRSEP